MKDENIIIEPHNPSSYEIIGKLILGLLVGTGTGLLIFFILLFTSNLFETAINRSSSMSPVVVVIFILIGFLGTLIGTSIIAAFLNLIFNEKYYDIKAIFSSIIIANLFSFILALPFYLIAFGSINQLFMILAIHTIFSIFGSFSLIEFTTNPNYSAKHFIGSSIGMALSFIVFFLLYKGIDQHASQQRQILLFVPAISAYIIIPFVHAIFEKLYFKLYQSGSDFLYTPSIDDVLVEQEVNDKINIQD